MLDMIEFAWNDALGNLLQVGLTASAAALVLLLLRRVMKKAQKGALHALDQLESIRR